MKKKSIFGVTSLLMFLGGCATTASPQMQPMIDNEPLLVGKPVVQRISEVSHEIKDQLYLLNKVQQGGRVGSFSVVEHNNNLEARIGSNRTIPSSYGKEEPKPDELNKNKIKKIDWQNNSLNLLVSNFAKALGYQIVIKNSSILDKNINFSVENMSVLQALDKLKFQVSPFADLVVISNNKTVNLLYKN